MSNFEIRKTKNKGKGLFTSVPFDKNQPIFQFKGDHITLTEINKNNISSEISKDFLQIGEELYLNIDKHYSMFANHSCRPNCAIKIVLNQAFLVALQDIPAGSELFFDYSITSTDDKTAWKMDCACGNYACRKVISGFDTLPETKKQEYMKLGIVPKYLLKG